jgi:dienelactone hydrolase
MTDFFGGNPSDLTTFPPKTPSQLNFTKAFMTGPADPDKTVPFIAPIIAEIQHAHPEIESSAILGFCWGGKSQLSSRSREVFSRLRGSVHPSLVDLEDANKVTIPMVFLPSMVEDVDVSIAFNQKVYILLTLVLFQVMEQYGKNLKAASLESYCETFTDQAHGWMTSR